MKKGLVLLLATALLLSVAGCSDRQHPVDEIKPSSEPIRASVAEPPVSEAKEPATSAPETAPAQGIEMTIELAQKILERWRGNFEQGSNAPGSMGEFLETHPNYLIDRSNRMRFNTGKEVEDGGEHARLLLSKGQSPADDLINRERLALFVENYRSKTPDSIVILSSGEPIALWLTVFTYSGNLL